MIEGILIEGLVYGIMALGIFISFRVLDFADLTSEGAFPFGAAVGGALLAGGKPIFLALLAGFAAGALAGAITSAIHHGFKVPALLAGIVTTTGLYSINLRVLGGRANLPLIGDLNPVMRASEAWLGPQADPSLASFAAFALGSLALVALFDLFFHTELGLSLGALGDNETSVVSAGINPVALRTLGVALANGLVGLSGVLAASYQGFADVNFGQGVVAAGLASVMLGELLMRTSRIGGQLLRVLLGSVLFRAIMYAGRSWGYLAGITPNDLKLLTAVLVVAALALSRSRENIALRRSLSGKRYATEAARAKGGSK
jgi:putative tryptophan/tyrosine transport system permease protein